MKILCLSRAPLDFRGGIPAYCLNLYKNKLFNVINYSYDINKNLKVKLTRNISNIPEIVFPSEFKFGTIAISIKYVLEIIFRTKNVDIIHLQHPDPLSAFSSIIFKLRYPKTKLVVSWHADIYKNYLMVAPILVILDIILYAFSSKIIFFTPEHLKNSFISKIKWLKSKTKIIHNCIQIKEKIYQEKIFNKYGIKNKNEINLLSIGRLVNYKGYEYSIKSLKYINHNVKYRIIGNGPLKEKLSILIRELNLEDKVYLEGEVSEKTKIKLLLDADIFIFPSINRAEAYGLVQLEAMAFKLPIINTNLRNGVNYLAPKDIAITCNPKNDYEIFKSIQELIFNNKKYITLSQKSFNNFKKFNVDEMRLGFKKLIEDI